MVRRSGVLQRNIGRSVEIGEYLTLAWMLSSVAIVGGALGSDLESDEAVRSAAYSERER